MKKFILLASLLITTNCFAGVLYNYNKIKAAVISGKAIHIVIDFSKCSSPKNESTQAMSVIAVYAPNSLLVMNDHIATSLTHFTLNNPSFPGKPIYEFVRYTISDNNTVNVTEQILDANYTPLLHDFSFTCKLNSGAKIYT